MSPTNENSQPIDTTAVEKIDPITTAQLGESAGPIPMQEELDELRKGAGDGPVTQEVPVAKSESESTELNDIKTPVKFDASTVKPIERKRTQSISERSRISFFKKALAAGTVVLAGLGIGAGANALLGEGDSTPVNPENKTEVSVSTTSTTTTTTIEAPKPEDMIPPAFIELGPDGNPVDVVPGQGSSDTDEKVPQIAPVANIETRETVPSSNEGAAAETLTAEETVKKAVQLVDYLNSNQQITGLSPIIEVIDSENGSLTFNDPNFSITVYGQMNDRILVPDPLSRMNGSSNIIFSDSISGDIVDIKGDETSGETALKVTFNGRVVTTNPELFKSTESDPVFAVNHGDQIISKIEEKARSLRLNA